MLQGTNEVLEADIVICNSDLVYSYTNLLPSTSYSRSLSQRDASCSSISFYWALDRKFPELSAHNIFLAEDYRESFDSIFKKHQIPSQPSFYVNVPSRVDPTAAPPNCDTLVVLVPVGHLLSHANNTHKGSPLCPGATQDWDSMVASARSTILETMETRLHVSLADHIVHESINTPPTWKDTFNLDRGAILGLSHSFFNVLSFRPKTTHPSIKQLFFVGASTHPGTGVPIVLAGAKIVAEQVLGQWGLRGPWRNLDEEVIDQAGIGASVMLGGKAQIRGQKGFSELDQVRRMPVLSWLHWAFVLLITVFISLFSAVGGRWSWEGNRGFVGDW